MIIPLSDLSELPFGAQKLLKYAAGSRVFLLKGEMGAGKTTFIKAVCAELGVKNPVSSPTFALVNEYEYPDGLVYHFDCYRLKSANEALDIGFEEYLASGEYCFIEWPEKVEALWPSTYALITIEFINPNSRMLSVQIVD